MGSKPMRSSAISASRIRRKSNNSRRGFAAGKKNAVNCRNDGAGNEDVEEKLEMLKNLLPDCSQNQRSATAGGANVDESVMKADNDIFRRTSDYIVLLRTQTFVLERLIDFYTSQQKIDDRSFVSISTPAAAADEST